MERTTFIAIVILAFALIPIALIVFVVGATRHSESVARGERKSPLLVWLSSLVMLPLAAFALITGHGLLAVNAAVLNGLFVALLMRQAYQSSSDPRHLVFWERATAVMLGIVLLGGIWKAVQSAVSGEPLFSQTTLNTLALIGIVWMYRRGRDAITNSARQPGRVQ
ncbi:MULTISPECIES: hypothetical protein [Denitromonas]|uniref:Uncharacterized protein n=2 Tax=Denitromonas TaxID=139331 RepID=A0A558DWF9_9RHOO|nr:MULTISPECIES: hypothetical protein [Denitromonas]TVT47438.1 MAG: hypothetical protein FHP94_15275 [Denitromonas halophila]TVO65009.1 hypothetical protein FHP90_11790 [Denitromonas ohlonensis]TVO75682.1 hypothetical protein FHP89_13150 [Denitromonas ohlonensis]TVT65381.1 MAG: hypothetical protein FHP93_20095 [Denitromonas halophila]TVT78657.1 MAG: hypothetical protein FHP92_00160 [Denitromonas halophila]